MTVQLTPLIRPFLVARTPSEPRFRGAVMAIGNFDGVHRGHRAVIDAAQELGQASGRLAVALTFEPHPRAFLRPDQPMFRLTDEAAKLRLLAGTALTGALVLPFDAGLASLSAQDFIDSILMRDLAVSGIAVGFDFHFGKGRTGSPALLAAEGERHGVPVTVVPPFQAGAVPVSSSAIRSLLAQGQVREAADLLGYPWFVTATVIHGEKRGRELGYPTANLRLDPACGLRHGIYAVRIGIGEARFDGVASFGRRPTFDDGAPLLEVFVFGLDGDLYGQTLDVAFIGWIRAERKFDNVQALVARMDADSQEARARLAAAPDRFPPLGPVGFAP